jgi:putative redox protein
MTGSPKPIPPRQTATGPIARSHSVWRGGMRFESGIDGRMHLIDGDSKTAPSPVETLVNAFATCAGSDVIDFMEKRRTPVSRLEIDVAAARRAEHPRRIMAVEMTFTLDGATIEADQAERAIRLSFEKYCTVGASLAGDIALTSILVLNGTTQPPIQQPMFSASL